MKSKHLSVASRASDTVRRSDHSGGSAVTNESLDTVPSFNRRTSSKHSLVMAHAKRPDDVLSFYADVEYNQYVPVNKQNVNISIEFDEYANKQEQYVIDELREYVTNNPQDDLVILHEEEEVGGEGMDDENENDEQTKKDERTDIVYEGNGNDGDAVDADGQEQIEISDAGNPTNETVNGSFGATDHDTQSGMKSVEMQPVKQTENANREKVDG